MPYSDLDARRKMKRRRARERRALGLCATCSQEARPDMAHCQPCADKGVVYKRAWRAKQATQRGQ